MATYDPKSIANFFIEVAQEEGKKITPLKLIKLVYIAHGYYLASTGEPLISQAPQAWKFGPVIPELYHSLKMYGNEPITEKITDFRMVSRSTLSFVREETAIPGDTRIQEFLRSVWNSYKRFTASQLSTLTHQPGTPWSITWEKFGAKYRNGVDIPEDLIREHYRELKQRYARPNAGK